MIHHTGAGKNAVHPASPPKGVDIEMGEGGKEGGGKKKHHKKLAYVQRMPSLKSQR